MIQQEKKDLFILSFLFSIDVNFEQLLYRNLNLSFTCFDSCSVYVKEKWGEEKRNIEWIAY